MFACFLELKKILMSYLVSLAIAKVERGGKIGIDWLDWLGVERCNKFNRYQPPSSLF